MIPNVVSGVLVSSVLDRLVVNDRFTVNPLPSQERVITSGSENEELHTMDTLVKVMESMVANRSMDSVKSVCDRHDESEWDDLLEDFEWIRTTDILHDILKMLNSRETTLRSSAQNQRVDDRMDAYDGIHMRESNTSGFLRRNTGGTLLVVDNAKEEERKNSPHQNMKECLSRSRGKTATKCRNSPMKALLVGVVTLIASGISGCSAICEPPISKLEGPNSKFHSAHYGHHGSTLSNTHRDVFILSDADRAVNEDFLFAMEFARNKMRNHIRKICNRLEAMTNRIDFARVDSARVESVRVESVRVESVRVESVRDHVNSIRESLSSRVDSLRKALAHDMNLRDQLVTMACAIAILMGVNRIEEDSVRGFLTRIFSRLRSSRVSSRLGLGRNQEFHRGSFHNDSVRDRLYHDELTTEYHPTAVSTSYNPISGSYDSLTESTPDSMMNDARSAPPKSARILEAPANDTPTSAATTSNPTSLRANSSYTASTSASETASAFRRNLWRRIASQGTVRAGGDDTTGTGEDVISHAKDEDGIFAAERVTFNEKSVYNPKKFYSDSTPYSSDDPISCDDGLERGEVPGKEANKRHLVQPGEAIAVTSPADDG